VPSFRDRLTGMQRRYISRSEQARRDAAAENKAMVKSLVDAALARTDLRPDVSGRSNILRLLCAMFELNGGSLGFHRGWVEAVRTVFQEEGLPVPNAKVCRSYRSHLQESPFRFETVPLVDVETLARIEAKYLD
jgi:hypothetical protein